MRLFDSQGKGPAENAAFDSESENSIFVSDDIPEDVLAEVEDARPSDWRVAKEMFGINIFTYVLAAAIAFFLGMNYVLGPGWLGNTIGLEGTSIPGDTSSSLPNTLDLGNQEYLL